MEKRTEEWLRQADYDMDTAEYMYLGRRYIYAVFMCHLAIEKALKGLYFEKRRTLSPKAHSQFYLLSEIGERPPDEKDRFIVKLNEASIPTRYPEDLSLAQKNYPEHIVKSILAGGKEVIAWIRGLF
jgi:HEPN domain-containing protein